MRAATTALVAALALAACHREPPLPRYGAVPAFELVDQAGRPAGTAQLRGRPAVVAFFFARCTSVCPRITADMQRLQDKLAQAGLGDKVTLVSITVDPENDTPQVLAAYARAHGAGPRWLYLTGPADAVKHAVVDGFKQSMDRGAPTAADPINILHGARLVLLDGTSEMRGFYPSGDVDAVVDGVRALAGGR